MRTIQPLCTIVLVMTCSVAALAQTAASDQDKTTVEDLKAPTAPAFVVLGVSPSKIERPQAVRPLIMSALSAVSSEGFPRNYAVEFAPYWLGTPQLSFKEYYESGVVKAIPRHLSVSVATTPLGKAADSGTAIAFGARTLPLPGRAHPKLKPLLDKLHDLQRRSIGEEGRFSRHEAFIKLLREAQASATKTTAEELSAKAVVDLIDRVVELDIELDKVQIALEAIPEEMEEAKKLPPAAAKAELARLERDLAEAKAALPKLQKERKELGDQMVKAVGSTAVAASLATERQFETLVARYDQAQRVRIAQTDAQLKSTALAIQDLDSHRVGPLLAVATALAWDVPSDRTSLTSLSRVGFWVTPGYRFVRCPTPEQCSTPIDVLGVVRYLDNRRAGESGDTWEYGARAVWQATPKLAASAEWLGRTTDDESGTRVVGVAEYEVTESVFVYASFGRDFEEAGVRQNLVSTIGLSFGLGKKPILLLNR